MLSDWPMWVCLAKDSVGFRFGSCCLSRRFNAIEFFMNKDSIDAWPTWSGCLFFLPTGSKLISCRTDERSRLAYQNGCSTRFPLLNSTFCEQHQFIVCFVSIFRCVSFVKGCDCDLLLRLNLIALFWSWIGDNAVPKIVDCFGRFQSKLQIWIGFSFYRLNFTCKLISSCFEILLLLPTRPCVCLELALN